MADNDDNGNGNGNGNEDGTDVNTMLLKVLLKKVGSDPYPSATMMDTIEEMLTPEATPVYARLLLERIDRDEFPSIDMIDRVRHLAGRESAHA